MRYNCQNCGAAIDTVRCPYCGTRNAIDLSQAFIMLEERNERICPNCDIHLATHVLNTKERLYVDICPECKGLFLDHGELETIMEQEIVKREKYDLKRLEEIREHPLVRERNVRYKKCPQCRKVMLRLNYRKMSGVIIDRCKEHGYWLDAGELRQIMEWAKLEGLRDFSPMAPESVLTATKPVSNRNGFSKSERIGEFDPILSFFRKLYGF